VSKVRFTRRAERDLHEISEYISKRSPAASVRFAEVVRDITEILRNHPYLGAQNRENPNIRSWLVAGFPYRLHYLIRDGDLLVIHIRHAARRPCPESDR
jgi:toxin ParE1/3/4